MKGYLSIRDRSPQIDKLLHRDKTLQQQPQPKCDYIREFDQQQQQQ